MRKKRKKLCRYTACVVAISVLAVSQSGCANVMNKLYDAVTGVLPGVTPGQTVSEDSKWVNSQIEGSLAADTPTNKKDDFYTAVNKDWLFEAAIPEGEVTVGGFEDSMNNISDRIMSILLGTEDEEADLTNELPGLTITQVDHDLELVQKFVALAGDMVGRNAAGVEPARTYIEAVAGMKSMEDMSAYLKNANGQNIALNQLIPFGVSIPYTDQNSYVVTIGNRPALSLWNQENRMNSDYALYYRSLQEKASRKKNLTFEKTEYLLSRLGWKQEDIKLVLHRCLQFEQKLAHSLFDWSILKADDYEKLYQMTDHHMTKEELMELEGDYPLVDILESSGMADSEYFVVAEPDYVHAVGKLYQQQNLEEIKAYFLVHTIPTLLPLLDEESAALAKYEGKTVNRIANDQENKKELEIFNQYVIAYLSDPFQQIYVARYCTKEQKEKLQVMIEEILTAYRTMIAKEEWMGEETRAKALEKLEHMTVRNLYPDEFVNYQELAIGEDDTLVEAVAAICRFNRKKDSQRIGQPINNSSWDMAMMPTLEVNSMYLPTENSINLLAGMFSSKFFFDEQMSDEVLLAQPGTIIGHEISHAFDLSGSQYDGAGYHVNWWDAEDLDRYQLRTSHLMKDYNTQGLAPGYMSSSYGKQVNTEAVADMAGVKVTLLAAAGKQDFDYDTFFTAYAKMWRRKYRFGDLIRMSLDTHPLEFLRCNKTLQQFDEFLDTYGIEPGDGMYLESEKRILVW